MIQPPRGGEHARHAVPFASMRSRAYAALRDHLAATNVWIGNHGCAYSAAVDERRFVAGLMAAVPEAFADPEDRAYYLGDEPLSYPALGDARIWIEDHALEISGVARVRAQVKAEHADAFARFWDFVESQAYYARDDTALRTLLQIECFEGVGWVEDVMEYVGPETRALLVDAQQWLARYNRQVGCWAPRGVRPKRRD